MSAIPEAQKGQSAAAAEKPPVVEMVDRYPGNAPSPGKILDLFMLMVGGRERTPTEYRALFEQAGYELKRIIPTATPLHVIEATAR